MGCGVSNTAASHGDDYRSVTYPDDERLHEDYDFDHAQASDGESFTHHTFLDFARPRKSIAEDAAEPSGLGRKARELVAIANARWHHGINGDAEQFEAAPESDKQIAACCARCRDWLEECSNPPRTVSRAESTLSTASRSEPRTAWSDFTSADSFVRNNVSSMRGAGESSHSAFLMSMTTNPQSDLEMPGFHSPRIELPVPKTVSDFRPRGASRTPVPIAMQGTPLRCDTLAKHEMMLTPKQAELAPSCE
jgi:hypothetical protein